MMRFARCLIVLVLFLSATCLGNSDNVVFRFSLASNAVVTLKIYQDHYADGVAEIRTVVNQQSYGAGVRTITWNGCNDAGTGVASGQYGYVLSVVMNGNDMSKIGIIHYIK